MIDWIVYLIKVMAIQAIGFGCYYFFFARTKFHQWNRIFLLLSLFGAFAVPFIEIPEVISEPVRIAVQVDRFEEFPSHLSAVLEVVPVQSEFNWWYLILGIYAMGVVWFILRFLVFLSYIQKLKKQSEYVNKQWFKLFISPHSRAFSFLRSVFIPQQLVGTDTIRQVLDHECVHVRQHHSVDRLLMDLVISLFWFNPFMYLYRNALIEIHEYLADEAVITENGDLIKYQEALFSQLTSAKRVGLMSHFNFSMMKKRIVMMNKSKNKNAAWRYVIIAPLVISVVLTFSTGKAMASVDIVGNTFMEVFGPEPDFQASSDWEQLRSIFQQDLVPSILPIGDAKAIRLTSGFGQRIDPITKEKKYHRGVDFAAPLGTSVISSADGEVILVEFQQGGYGLHVKIQHGEEYVTHYAQLSKIDVRVGEKVSKGQKIGEVGSSGRSTAPHLHYEVIRDGKPQNPEGYIRDYKFENN